MCEHRKAAVTERGVGKESTYLYRFINSRSRSLPAIDYQSPPQGKRQAPSWTAYSGVFKLFIRTAVFVYANQTDSFHLRDAELPRACQGLASKVHQKQFKTSFLLTGSKW